MDYQQHYNVLIERAKNRILDIKTETHHIIPRCMEGTDDKSNLVELTLEDTKMKIKEANLGKKRSYKEGGSWIMIKAGV